MSDDFQYLQPPSVPEPTPRVISPVQGEGISLDGRHFRLEDVDELARTLLQHTEGRLARLRRTVSDVESKLRERVESSRERIDRALGLADALIERRLEDTRRRSEEILEQRSREGLESGQEEGFRKGYEEGLEKGLKEGRAQGEAAAREELTTAFSEETRTAKDALTAVMEQVENQWRESFEKSRSELIRLVLDIAEQVVMHEVEAIPETIERKLHCGLDRMATESRLRVAVHPTDREAATRYLEGLGDQLVRNRTIEFVDDPEVGRGGCRIEGEGATVDLSTGVQLDVLARRLQEAGGIS